MMSVNDMVCIAGTSDTGLLSACIVVVLAAYGVMFALSFMEEAHREIRLLQREMDKPGTGRDCESVKGEGSM